MSWKPPHLPTGSYQSIVAYWKTILEIPLDEPGATMLRGMASRRLAELEVILAGSLIDREDRQVLEQHASRKHTRRLPA